MDAIVISGADPRLESEIETGRDDALHFRSAADGEHYAVYGPYLALPAGRYRIELGLTVDARATGRVAIELCHSGARVRLYDRPCFEWELARGFIRISFGQKTRTAGSRMPTRGQRGGAGGGPLQFFGRPVMPSPGSE